MKPWKKDFLIGEPFTLKGVLFRLVCVNARGLTLRRISPICPATSHNVNNQNSLNANTRGSSDPVRS